MSTATLNGVFPQDPRSAAELYILRQLAPISLPDRKKDPGRTGWESERLTLDDLDTHFPPGVSRTVGLLNGEPSNNLVDLDLDCVQALRAAPVLMPRTGWLFGRKSAPKSHRLYRTDVPLRTAQIAYEDVAGGVMLLELRGTGGLTVAPPSNHEETGERIAWESFAEEGPAEVKLADLERLAGELASVSLLARHWPPRPAPGEHGCRHRCYLALAGGLLNAGWTEEGAEKFIEALTVATDDEEARGRVRNVASTAEKKEEGRHVYGWPKLAQLLGQNGDAVVRQVRVWLGMEGMKLRPTGKPSGKVAARPLAAYTPFPTNVLPEPIRSYVTEGARALGCDPSFIALPALAVVASLIGNTRVVRLRGGAFRWEEPAVAWTGIVGESGTLKSPAYQAAVGHIFRLQKQRFDAFKERLEAYQTQKVEYDDRKREAKKKKEGFDESPPEPPVQERIITSDVTIERLAEILEDNPRGTLVARDELAGWLGSFTRYKGKAGGSDLPNWLEMHRAGTVVVDRKTGDRRTLYIPGAAVSVTGGIQPGTLARALTPELLDAGGAARLWLAMPPRLPKEWREVEIDLKVRQDYENLLDNLLTLDFGSEGEGEKRERAPHVLRLSSEAKRAWIKFYNEWAREQAAVEGEQAAALSKLEGGAARLALLHHVVTHTSTTLQDPIPEEGGETTDADLVPIEAVSVEAGATLCRWFAGEARRIYSMLAESDEGRDARKLVEFISSRGGWVTARQLQRSNNRKYPSVEDAEAALELLVKSGAGKWVERPAGPKGGRPTRVCELCTTHDTTDTTSGDGEDDDDGDWPPPHDTTPDTTTDAPQGTTRIPKDSAGSVSCVMRRAEETVAGEPVGLNGTHGQQADKDEEVVSVGCVTQPQANKQTPDYFLVRNDAGLADVLTALQAGGTVALDTETTGLDPHTDRARLLSLSVPTIGGEPFTYVVDCFGVDPAPLWDLLAECDLILHHAAFDLAFLSRLGFTPRAKVHDTMLLAQLLTAGTRDKVKLGDCCERWLGRALDKTEQKSDWTGELTADQLAYAARDVEVLAPLLRALTAEVEKAGLSAVAEIEGRCLPALVWMGQKGVALDRQAWTALASEADGEADRIREELDRAGPARPGQLFGWNWDSTQQAQQALGLVGCTVEDTSDEALAAVDHPLAQMLRRYRLARKRGTTYGSDWLEHIHEDGRVYSTWRQLGAASGRMSNSRPNMQQVPRGAHRRCIVAPAGRLLVKADYSQIELRIGAKVSGDRNLLDAYQRGEDLHTLTARSVLGVETVTKEHRQLAKALNFGLLYGMGAEGFRVYAQSKYDLPLSLEDARRYREAFFDAYPGLRAWHRRTGKTGKAAIETCTLAGRRRLNVGAFTQKLNTPVQGTGADGLKLALALLWERREEVPGAFPVLAVHDEVVIECDEAQADAVSAWLRTAMVEAMAPLTDPVPVEVGVKVGKTWGA